MVVLVACLLCTCDILQTSRLLNQSVVKKLLFFFQEAYGISGEVGVSLILATHLPLEERLGCMLVVEMSGM